MIGIGPLTNFRLLEEAHPGTLATTDYVQMGGYFVPPRDGYPQWANEDDFNIQVDAASSFHVLTTSTPLLVPLTLTVETALRRSDLAPLRTAGPLGELIAGQAEEFALDEQMAERFGATLANVPADIINFQHDALACAIALGWRDGVTIEEFPLVFDRNDAGFVQARIDPSGRRFRVVTAIDGRRFNDFWLETITRAG
jgi:inosine-uridine nucleoside N-ribohydrolase